MKLASVLTDKRVLYLISAIAAYCFIGSIAVGNTKKAEAMVVGGIMIRAVSSNMIYVLLASIIAGLLVSYFLPMKEGMVDDDSASITVDANSIQEAVAKVKRVNQKKNERKEEKERAEGTSPIDENEDKVNVPQLDAKSNATAIENITKQLGSEATGAMAKDTHAIIEQQKSLLKAMDDVKPLMQHASKLMATLNGASG